MVEDDRYCADVITQIAAVQESLRAVAKILLKNHLKHCASAALKRGESDAELIAGPFTNDLRGSYESIPRGSAARRSWCAYLTPKIS